MKVTCVTYIDREQWDEMVGPDGLPIYDPNTKVVKKQKVRDYMHAEFQGNGVYLRLDGEFGRFEVGREYEIGEVK